MHINNFFYQRKNIKKKIVSYVGELIISHLYQRKKISSWAVSWRFDLCVGQWEFNECTTQSPKTQTEKSFFLSQVSTTQQRKTKNTRPKNINLKP